MLLQENTAGINAAIAQARYDTALGNAQIMQAVQQEGAATRALIQENKYEMLKDKYDALSQRLSTQEMMGAIAAATANVVRYPTGFSYNAGPSPFCGCGAMNV